MLFIRIYQKASVYEICNQRRIKLVVYLTLLVIMFFLKFLIFLSLSLLSI
jgi:hypothetical protein